MSREYEGIPDTTIEALARYVNDKIPPGGFLLAVLENDLKEAFGRADIWNRGALHSIVSYLYNEVPSTCWGSPDRVRAWLVRP